MTNAEFIAAAKDIAEILAILVGGVYFALRVFYGKMFQRLSVEIDVLPLGPQPAAGHREIAIQCSIRNKGEARMVLNCLKYTLDPPGQQGGWQDFPANIAGGKSNAKYAIDAQSCAQFCQAVQVPSRTQAVTVTVEFCARKTGETYRAEKVVAIK